VDLRDTSASAYRLRPGVIGALNTRIISVWPCHLITLHAKQTITNVIGWWCDLITNIISMLLRLRRPQYQFAIVGRWLTWKDSAQPAVGCREPTFASRDPSDYKSEYPKGKPPQHA
jgi:hypothetical protein